MLSKSRFLFVYVVLAILIPSVAFSQDEEIMDYKVTSGDTLWTISGKELKDPFLWPKVWQENPNIANPDRIYPGQNIKIPLRYLQREVSPEPGAPEIAQKKEVVKKKEVAEKLPPESARLRPLIDKYALAASGFIAQTAAGVGIITGAPDRIVFGNDDIVYVNIDGPVKAGDQFYIIRDGGLIRHPVTNKKMGHMIEVLGIAEVVSLEDNDPMAKILKMFNDIHAGDLLLPYYEISPPMTTGEFRKPETNGGYVVASRYQHLGDTKLNVVYIDKGRRDGLEIGDVVRTVNIMDGHKVPTGAIQIIDCQETTSTAMVMENYTGPITVGNLVTKLK
jgi:hypothetical protein